MEIASDTITERDSSNLMEATEPMEDSSAVASTFKAESDPAEEIEEIGDENEEIGDGSEESGDENEESGDENEEIDDEYEESGDENEEVNAYSNSMWEFNPEWDVDSFENLKFDEEKEVKFTKYIDEKDVKDWLRFRRQHIENKGFYVDPELWPMYSYTKYRVVKDLESYAGLGQTHLELFQELACLCVQRFNQAQKEKEEEEKEKVEDLEFVRVVGGVNRIGYAHQSYITFMAREKPGGPDVEYQAKVWSEVEVVKGNDFNDFKHYPILCRRAPPPKTSNQN